MTAILRLVLSLLCLVCSGHGQRVDRTLERDAIGADVVSSVLSKLDSASIFNLPTTLAERQVQELFFRELAYVESQDGAECPLGERDGGIWRISRRIFDLTQQLNLDEIFDGICRIFCINWRDIGYDDLRSPLYSGLAVNIYLHHLYLTNQSSLQGASTDMDRALFWTVSFGESRAAPRWLSRIQQLRRIEGISFEKYALVNC